MSKTYFIADTHFNHYNIIKYCNRPFTNVKDMNKTIIDRWNNVVKRDDIVYHLGDFALDNFEEISNFRKQLNGRIFLVLGNHDTYNIKRYYEAGFDKVYDTPIIYSDYFILSHRPIFINENMPYANIFGHVHNNAVYETVTKYSYCVSVERIDYQPISFNDIVKEIASKQ